VDSLITIPNAKLLAVMGGDEPLLNAFKKANEVLLGAVQGIAELITRPGLINVDFADVRTVMSEMGMAMMGTGTARGEDRAIMAAQSAIGSPLLEDINLSGARGLLVNITAGLNLCMREFEEVGTTVTDLASDDANVVIGTVIDPDMSDDIRVTVVATGLGADYPVAVKKEPPISIVRDGTTGNPHTFTQPFIAEEVVQAGVQSATPQENNELFAPQEGMEYLDIPAFLRRQAD
jgi:cell division protein FtsZ